MAKHIIRALSINVEPSIKEEQDVDTIQVEEVQKIRLRV
jgi:hypothetical protein